MSSPLRGNKLMNSLVGLFTCCVFTCVCVCVLYLSVCCVSSSSSSSFFLGRGYGSEKKAISKTQPGRFIRGKEDLEDMKQSYIFLSSDLQLVMLALALRAITLFQMQLREGRGLQGRRHPKNMARRRWGDGEPRWFGGAFTWKPKGKPHVYVSFFFVGGKRSLILRHTHLVHVSLPQFFCMEPDVRDPVPLKRKGSKPGPRKR